MNRALTALRLVRGATYDAAVEQQKKAEGRAKKLAQQVEEVRADSRSWKAKADQAHDQLREAQIAAAAAVKEAQRAEKMRAEAEKRLTQESQRTIDLETLQTKLADSERELVIAREQLMSIEVKLDILEGAANVLDSRTRAVTAHRQKHGSDRPV